MGGEAGRVAAASRRVRRARPVAAGDVQGARWQHLPARGLKRRRKEGAKHESPSEPQPPPAAAERASTGPAAAAAAVPPRGHPSYGTTASEGLVLPPPPPAARPAPSLGASARQRQLLKPVRRFCTTSPASREHPPRPAHTPPHTPAGGLFPRFCPSPLRLFGSGGGRKRFSLRRLFLIATVIIPLQTFPFWGREVVS